MTKYTRNQTAVKNEAAEIEAAYNRAKQPYDAAISYVSETQFIGKEQPEGTDTVTLLAFIYDKDELRVCDLPEKAWMRFSNNGRRRQWRGISSISGRADPSRTRSYSS